MPVFLRLIASALAVLGLSGHGLAMLFVGLLAGPLPAASAMHFFGDICTPNGFVSLASSDVTESGESDSSHGSEQNGCLVCTAFAHHANADLPAGVILDLPVCCGATQSFAITALRAEVHVLAAHPRAPPAAA